MGMCEHCAVGAGASLCRRSHRRHYCPAEVQTSAGCVPNCIKNPHSSKPDIRLRPDLASRCSAAKRGTSSLLRKVGGYAEGKRNHLHDLSHHFTWEADKCDWVRYYSITLRRGEKMSSARRNKNACSWEAEPIRDDRWCDRCGLANRYLIQPQSS